MDCVAHALASLRWTIPPEVINLVFSGSLYGYRAMTGLDENIMATVIRPRVMFDANLVGGTEIFIDLNGIPVERQNDYTSIYRIPKEKTDGRSIISVLNITFSDPSKVSSYGVAAGDQNTRMLQGFQSMMDAMGTIPVTSTAYVQLIAENTVMVRDTLVLPANIYLRCRLENDNTLSHVQLRNYAQFATLVEYAVKAYIYNQYTVRLDRAALSGGQDLSRVKEIIDEYKDSDQLYREYLHKWAKISMMGDRETWQRMIRLQMGGPR